MCMSSLLRPGNQCPGESGKGVSAQSRGTLYSMLRFAHFLLKAGASHSFFVR